MRQLRLVAPTPPDVDGGDCLVLETADGAERFSLPLDPALRDAVRAREIRPALSSGEPKLAPREIQKRVRGGESPQALADDSGATLDWVMRFAQPVLAERARITEEARRAKARRSTTDGEIVVFNEAVEARYAAHGVDPASVSWDAFRREDGTWALVARWLGGEDEHTAEWTFHLTSGRSVTPADDTAAELLSDRPIRPIVAPRPTVPTQPASEPVLSLAPPATQGVVVFPARPDADTGPLPRVDHPYDSAAFDARFPAAPRHDAPAAAPSAEAAPDDPSLDEPPLPLGLPANKTSAPAATPSSRPSRQARSTNRRAGHANRAGNGAAEAEDDKAARARIPAWDDILLGVRRRQD